jgi:hypothetical protein
MINVLNTLSSICLANAITTKIDNMPTKTEMGIPALLAADKVDELKSLSIVPILAGRASAYDLTA